MASEKARFRIGDEEFIMECLRGLGKRAVNSVFPGSVKAIYSFSWLQDCFYNITHFSWVVY